MIDIQAISSIRIVSRIASKRVSKSDHEKPMFDVWFLQPCDPSLFSDGMEWTSLKDPISISEFEVFGISHELLEPLIIGEADILQVNDDDENDKFPSFMKLIMVKGALE